MLRCLIGFLIVSLLTACASAPVQQDPSRMRELIVRGMRYDDQGLPVIGPVLGKRPSEPGDHFTLVRLEERRVVISYDIAVVHRKPDFTKPFQAVYEWTGRGFEWGAEGMGAFNGTIVITSGNRDEALVGLAIIVSPLAIGTVGGFIVGLAEGIRQTALELGNVILNDERVITCTQYDYDDAGRLIRMRQLTPDESREIVRTEFIYEGNSTRPARTVVKSLVEGKERDIL